MARTNPKQQYHYQFQVEETPTLHTAAKFHWAVRKFEADGDGRPIEEYYVWSDHPQALDSTTHCSCPAAYHARRPNFQDKHVLWLRRWLAIMKMRDEELEKPSNQRRRELLNPVYYDASDDRFYPFPILAFGGDEEE